MTQIVADAEMAKQLAVADAPVNVVDEAGAVIAVCTPVRTRLSPLALAELQRRRKEAREHPELGRPLAEFWAEFLKQHGEQP